MLENVYTKRKYCTYCGELFKKPNLQSKKCTNCNLWTFSNPSPTVGAIIESGEMIITTRRNQDPYKGKLEVPGGFLNFGEDPEVGLKREISEEINIEIKIKELFSVSTHDYPFQNMQYSCLMTVYIAYLVGDIPIRFEFDKSEIQEVLVISRDQYFTLSKEDFGFDVDWDIFTKYKKRYRS